MAFPGPNVPHRTSRKRALEVGTASAGFTPAVPYDTRAGHPTSVPGGAYAPAKMAPGGAAKALQTSNTPFKVGGGS